MDTQLQKIRRFIDLTNANFDAGHAFKITSVGLGDAGRWYANVSEGFFNHVWVNSLAEIQRERNEKNIAERMERYAATKTPQVGDVVRYQDGTVRRIAHIWAFKDDAESEYRFQPTDSARSGSFHLSDNGSVSHSGSLDGCQEWERLMHNGEFLRVAFWTWGAHGSGGNKGVHFTACVPVWEYRG